ncbi:CopD family protein [Lutibaculum baratangense]|uniref:Protoporphyrinogen IX oxidase n=1 Tax=Lutibaculum baratangense AMV1 TaxID=631454 RepID=V4QU09_9HYPH|nr:CopD family protein [Lutibaculum baratangense]ESR23262.1 hypothetical protein N177_3330 [Lutibaculum baratangense AMV1]
MEAATVWLKAIHVSTILIWAAGLFYLPGLFAAHHVRTGEHFRRLRLMTRLTYLGVTSPAAILAIVSGGALIYVNDAYGGWLVVKLTLVGMMMGFHILCGHMVDKLRSGPAMWSPAAQRALMVVPALLIPGILVMVLGKPI